MLYAIMARDVAESTNKRAAVRSRHLEYVEALLRDGRLVFAGPHPAVDSPDPGPAGVTGSLVIAEFESLEAAELWAANDPYRIEGVFADVEIKPVLQTLP
ncbi:MAG TPA: YciI family protein [Gammaproteobacteria bacterium]